VAGTLDYGLHYTRAPGTTLDTSKSTSGTMFFLGNCFVSWQSLKQKVVALSSYEAKYIATTTASTQALWLSWLLGELKVDSKSALALAKNPVFHERNKHIRIKYHFIRSCLEDGCIKAIHIPTTDQLLMSSPSRWARPSSKT